MLRSILTNHGSCDRTYGKQISLYMFRLKGPRKTTRKERDFNIVKGNTAVVGIMVLFSLSRMKEDRLAWPCVRSAIMKLRVEAGAWLGRRTRFRSRRYESRNFRVDVCVC